MILAAGRGERMRPLSDAVPKPLLEVAGKPLVVHAVERLVEAGFTELVVNLGWRGRQIRECLDDGSRWGASISYSDEGGRPIGTGAGIVRALPLLGPGPFVVTSSDLRTDFRFDRLRPVAVREVHLVLVPNPDHNPGGDFALKGGSLLRSGPDRLTYSGIGVFSPAAFRPALPGVAALAPYLDRACDRGAATGEVHRGVCDNVGTPAQLAAARGRTSRTPRLPGQHPDRPPSRRPRADRGSNPG